MGERRVAVHLAHPWFEERCSATEQHRGKVQAQLVLFLTNHSAAVRTRGPAGQLLPFSLSLSAPGEALEAGGLRTEAETAVLHGLAEMPRRPNGFV